MDQGAYLLRINSDTLDCLIEAGKDRLTLHPKGDSLGSYTLDASVGLQTFPLLTRDRKGLRIQTWNGGTFPVFWRAEHGFLILSNRPHLLLRKGETVEVKAQVVASRIAGSGNQLYNPFVTVGLLEDSSVHRLSGATPVRSESVFRIDQGATHERLIEVWRARFAAYAAEGRPMAVPLSGGYDSRLILALAEDAGVREIECFHEYKDDEEQRIAERVAAAFERPLRTFRRDTDLSRRRQLSTDTSFILLSGLNRQNIRRWTAHCQNMMRLCNPRIAGLAGAEPHKGKYYRKIEDFDSDIQKVFRISRTSEARGAAALRLSGYHDFHTEYLKDLGRSSAQIFEDRESRIDFVHYHAYMVNSYGYRSAYFSDRFGIDYPQHDTTFLNTAFCLPRAEKEGFKVILHALRDYGGAARDIEFISANEKTLKAKPSLVSKLVARMKASRKHRSAGELDAEMIAHEPQGELAALLRQAVTSARTAGISAPDAITAFNYFATLEREYEVEFRLV